GDLACPLVSRPQRDAHPCRRGRLAVELLQRQLPGVRGRQEEAPGRGRCCPAPAALQAVDSRLTPALALRYEVCLTCCRADDQAAAEPMKRKNLKFGKGFRVAVDNGRPHAAEMVLASGAAEGSANNRHHGADQWLFVVSGTGTARVNGRRYALKSGTLMLIERGDRHEIRNTG